MLCTDGSLGSILRTIGHPTTIQEEETECKEEPGESTNQRENTHSGMQRTKRGRMNKPPERLNL